MSEQPAAAFTRLIRNATKIEPDELRATLISFVFIFLLSFAYNIMKPVRDALAPEWSDVELASLWSINFVFSTLAVSAYGWIVSRYRLKNVIPGVYVFFAASFVVFYIGALRAPESALVTKSFYVWISLFSLFYVSVFWSLMADLFNKQQAKRVFAFIASGTSLGTIAGSASTLFLAQRVGALNLMLAAAAILVVILPLIAILRSSASNTTTVAPEETLRGNPFAGFRSLIANPYLLGIAAFIFLYTFIGSFAYFELKNLMADNDRDTNAAIWAGINLSVNIVSIVTAWFVTSRINLTLGVGKTLALVPLLVAIGLAAVIVNPVLALVIVAWIILKGGNYGITRPAREMLYTNVSREDRFKAKQVIDIVVYRGGDVLSSWIFALLTTALGLGMGPVAAIGAGVALLWAYLGLRLGNKYDRTSPPGVNAAADTRGATP